MKNSIKSKRFCTYFKSVITILFLSLFYTNVQGQCTSTNDDLVQNPEEFQWTLESDGHYSGVMEVGEARFVLNNGEDLTTRAYRQQGSGEYSIPGPTIRVEPGNKYILSFHNLLPYEPKSEQHNVFKDPNVSNIHTHGLHISGESPGDDVTRSFEGGFGGDFVWDIPADHMGGTYWYHAHHHGSTFLQVSGGMFGLLIVDNDDETGLPQNGDGIPDGVKLMEERNIIFGFLDPAAAGTGGDTLLSGSLRSTWTINGLVEGNICLPANSWQRWRVLLADRAANMKTLEFGPEVEVMLLARDGVWRTVAPKELTENTLEMTGASRADFAIRTTGDSWIKINGTTVANIYIDGTNPDDEAIVHPFATAQGGTWEAHRPRYLRDLRGETNVNNEAVSMGARTINGGKFDINEATFTLPADQVQEWSLSGAVQHPFHLHVYHVQALKDDNDFEAGEYYDVVSSKMSVRFDLNQTSSTVYNGMTILHCHILSHEDRGAMGWLDVQGGIPHPEFPSGSSYKKYYSLSGTQQPPTAPSNLIASNPTSSSIDLTWQDNSSDEDYFDIERGIDGSNFNYLTSVGTNVVAYTDSGLAPLTTYYYRVNSSNIGGDSDFSIVDDATTLAGSGGGVDMYVRSITVSREALNGNRWRGVATVIIEDAVGNPIEGATVEGNFSGPSSSSESGTTNNNGEVTFNSQGKKNPNGVWCFDITDVSRAGFTYNGGTFGDCEVVSDNSSFKSTSLTKTLPGILESGFDIYPNPFREKLNISFKLAEQSHTSLEVYTVLGKCVAIITDQSYYAGQYNIVWAAKTLSSGMYFLKMRAGDFIETKRLILMR